MKLAMVCSWLNQYGGAERVLQVLHGMYPQAPVYTSIYLPEALPETFRSWDVRPTFLNRVPLARRYPSLFLEVISITSAFAHGVITSPRTQHVCYCLTPARFLWDCYCLTPARFLWDHTRYMERERIGRMTRWLLAPRLVKLRQWDQIAAGRVDQCSHRQVLPARVADRLSTGSSR